MKFFKGQKVECIAKRNEWNLIFPNFDDNLKVALGVIKVPKKGEVCIVKTPFLFQHEGKTNIEIEGYDYNFNQSAFKALEEKSEEEFLQKSINLKTQVN